LLRSEGGMSREEAKAGLSAEGEEPEPDEAVPARPLEEPGHDSADAGASNGRNEARFRLTLAARGVAKWIGSDLGLDHGAGAEAAFGTRSSRGFGVRGRATFEYGFGQSFESGALVASVRTTAVRGGVDVTYGFGLSALSLGALAGVDVSRLSPRAEPGSGLFLAADGTSTAPLFRIEARYELHVAAFCAAAGALTDVSLVDTHYDVADAAGARRVATASRVRPGVALTVGVCPVL
ncbi:MAG TPA: hypothetical protein VHE30_20600, partial [Polyangiaceae bacterium]|nr:hypothetical protein [Polyangiaceae bacterium]